MSNNRSGPANPRGVPLQSMRPARPVRPGQPGSPGRVARVAAGLLIALAAAGCATRAEPEAAPELPEVVRYAVEPGDRLSRIAEDFTGDVGLWRTIADLNGIDDPRRLAVGRVLEIPIALIPEEDRPARLAASAPDGKAPAGDGAAGAGSDAATGPAVPAGRDAAAADVPEPRRVRTTRPASPRASAPVTAAPSRAVLAATAPVVVSPVRTREAFELAPLDDVDAARTGAGERYVKVLGSYTPKGIYAAPEGRSRVLMRVTPGTVLRLERNVAGWHEVSTTAGTGYLRANDAQIVEPPPARGADAAGAGVGAGG